MSKKNILTAAAVIILGLFSIMPVCADTAVPQSPQNVQTKSELKHVLKKFVFAMSLVGGSCLILYFALRTYKRLKEQEDTTDTYIVDVTKDLTTPDNIDDATKLFIEKF